MLDLLRDAVNTDSGSYDKAGVDAVGQRFIDFFTAQGLLTTREPHDTFGDAIHIRLDDTLSNEKPILLMGHRDTVFPKGEAARRPFRIADGRAYGPGVCDMKAGLVINAFVLAAFKRFGGAPAPLAGLITSDEEIASPSSRPDHRARRAAGTLRVQLRAGPAERRRRHGPQGRRVPEVRSVRQGRALGRQLREGHQRHRRAGAQDRRHARADRPGARRHRQRRHHQGRPVGEHHGAARRGPDRPALCQAQDRATALAALQEIIDRATVPGTTAKLEISGEFLPLNATPASEELFATYQAAAADAGLKSPASSRAAARTRVSRPPSAARRCAPPARSAPTRIRQRNSWMSLPSSPAPRHWHWPSCASRRQREPAALGSPALSCIGLGIWWSRGGSNS